MISGETIKKLKENCKQISELLVENEKLIRSEGISPPTDNYSLNKDEKINFPSSYIRTNDAFQNKYHLREIVPNKVRRKNIAYSLQLSDFYNFLINRFYVWGSVETMLLKSAIINIVSIIEALTFECVNNICTCPDVCGKTSECDYHFNNRQRNRCAFEAIKKLNGLGITDFKPDELNRIHDIIEYRNHVHIRIAKENEFLNSDFSISTYNELVAFLKRIDNYIYCNGVPLYNYCKSD